MNVSPGFQFPGFWMRGRDIEHGASFSGGERNHLFLNLGEGRFSDLSLISGLDSPADGRSFATLDFDGDSWTDFAVVNANTPLLQLFRNRMGDSDAAGSAVEGSRAGSIALRLIGGNTTAAPNKQWSNRDGYGARVEITLGDRVLVRALRAGEGFAAMNSPTLRVGIGDRKTVDRVRVLWPSGRTSTVAAVPSGSTLVVFENPSAAGEDATDGAIVRPPADSRSRNARTPETASEAEPTRLLERLGDGARLRVLTTFATWCEACRRELPYVSLLRATFATEDVELYGIPIDPADADEKVAAWSERFEPAYRIVADLNEVERTRVAGWIGKRLIADALPASVVTDASGAVKATVFGIPTVSELRRLLAGD